MQGEAAFPASAPLPNGTQVHEQEVAALGHVLRDVNVRIHALKGVLIARDGPSHELQVSPQDAGRTGPSMFAQCQEQTETITALRETASALQACVTVRDAEIDALNERLFLVQRELDQSRRESAAQVKVSHLLFRAAHSSSNMLLFSQHLRATSVRAHLLI